MTIPLMLLAIPSLLLGLFLSWPGPPLGPLFGQSGPAPRGWLEPVFAHGLEILGHRRIGRSPSSASTAS